MLQHTVRISKRDQNIAKLTLREKRRKTEFFSGPYFSAFGLRFTE